MGRVWYCTREAVMDAFDVKESANRFAQVDAAIMGASLVISLLLAAVSVPVGYALAAFYREPVLIAVVSVYGLNFIPAVLRRTQGSRARQSLSRLSLRDSGTKKNGVCARAAVAERWQCASRVDFVRD